MNSKYVIRFKNTGTDYYKVKMLSEMLKYGFKNDDIFFCDYLENKDRYDGLVESIANSLNIKNIDKDSFIWYINGDMTYGKYQNRRLFKKLKKLEINDKYSIYVPKFLWLNNYIYYFGMKYSKAKLIIKLLQMESSSIFTDEFIEWFIDTEKYREKERIRL